MSVQSKPMRRGEFSKLDVPNGRAELVNGLVVVMPFEKPAHGYVCANVGCAIQRYVRANRYGRVCSNSCFIITTQDPDSVRNADVAYYSYQTVPAGPVDHEYWPSPELAFEVMSEYDRWTELTAKAGEYLRAGVKVVCVLDPGEAVLAVFRPDQSPVRLGRDDSFTVPELFPDFSVPVREFLD